MAGVAGGRVVFVSLVVAATIAGACGESRPPPKVAARPSGQGWFCWRNTRTKGSSSCFRSKGACEGSRKKAVGAKEGEGAAVYTDCDPQPKAGCFTHKTTAGEDGWFCACSYEDCESIARTLSRDPEKAADYDGMSQCEIWD